jgi:hypothetical protein
VRWYLSILAHFSQSLTEEEWAILNAKLEFRASDALMIAEDDAGASYNYSEEGFPADYAGVRAEDWLGVSPEFYD